MSRILTSLQLKKLQQEGFVDFGVLDPSRETLSVASQVGHPIKLSGLTHVQTLIPRDRSELPKNTYSGNYGKDTFPLHTDLAHWYLPPRYFVLRCVVPDLKVSTSILPFHDVMGDLDTLAITRAIFKPRRPLGGRLALLRFFQNNLYRWDPLYLVAENSEADKVAAHLKSLEKARIRQLTLSEKGHVILIDNWRVLHGRSSAKNSSNRIIDRVYLSEVHK